MSDAEMIPEALLIAHHSGDPAALADAALTARIAADPAAQAILADWRRQDAAMAALYGPVADEPVPDRLLAVLRGVAAPPHRTGGVLQIAALAALLIVGAAGGWAIARLSPAADAPRQLAETAQRTHATYVVEAAHPVEVTADDGTHLQAWLSKRLGHALTPPDFTPYGFRLMGGRVVPSDTGAAALLMYDDDQGRRITLFVEPGRGTADSAFQFTQGDHARTYSWDDEGISCAVTGDIPRDTLHAIALAAYGQLT